MKINGKDIKDLGFKGYCIGESLKIYEKHFKNSVESKSIILNKFREVLERPEDYLADEIFAPLAERLYVPPEPDNKHNLLKPDESIQPLIFGENFIDEKTKEQMNIAMRLPITIGGALMPDAHYGYGIPVGGVLVTQPDYVVPYAVGVDIACRMCLTIYDVKTSYLKSYKDKLIKTLQDDTRFGLGAKFEDNERNEHEVMDDKDFNNLPLLKGLKNKAWSQLGSSGGGNHFVEFGIVNMNGKEYIGLLSHSGSRGIGSTIADTYTRIAMETCKLPDEAKYLAWLELESEAGDEYWKLMEFAGKYASANHHCIHDRIAKKIGWFKDRIQTIENHHNFAWKDQEAGIDYIVHRKGATPARKDDLGVIPGSMTSTCYIVKGAGNSDSFFSASHGAGRKMSRNQTRNTYTKHDMKTDLKNKDVILIDGAVDESTFAYKDIDKVMKEQSTLVSILGKFQPKIVMMSKEKGED